MRAVFADASYWIALLNPRDALHNRAKLLAESLGRTWIVTSEMVFIELLNDHSRRGGALRSAAVRLIQRLRQNPNVSIVPQSSLQFQDALLLYAERGDKAWGLTDCSSFRIMHREGLTQALTYDHDFEQAGFRALLRDSS
jgi:uncharacterized protein